MAAILRILGWKAEGLRCPDHEIVFVDSSGSVFPVALIQMPNGTGKTTTLSLLRASLSGAAVGWNENRIVGFRKRGSNQPEGMFELKLRVGDRLATIAMVFDFENGNVVYNTTYGPGRREGFHPPVDYRRFMSETFVNFYVFDGELAQHLLDRDHSDAKVVVESLFQMNVFDSMARSIGDYWENQTRDVSAKEERGLTRRRNLVAELRDRIIDVRKEQTTLLTRQTQVKEELRNKEETYREEIRKEKTRHRALRYAEEEVSRLSGLVREDGLEILERMRDPHALSISFANSMRDLKNGLDRVQLPESAAREFFEDLAREDHCVCGRPIDRDIANIIRLRAIQYLGTEDVAFLNAMKSAIVDSIGSGRREGIRELQKSLKLLSDTVGEQRNAENQLDALIFQAGQSDPSIQGVRDSIKQLTQELRDIDIELEKFESEDSKQPVRRTYGIEVLKKKFRDAEKNLAEITNTLTEKRRRDILIDIVHRAHRTARLGVTQELCDEANTRISQLMPYNQVAIEQIHRHLILEGQEGGSAGETLSIAYAFLATLFHRAEHQLPFVVDSPAGPIDLAVRPKIGELVPKLSGQFIAFVISSERPGFVGPLKAASNRNLKFITLFRKGLAEFDEGVYDDGVVKKTSDGVCVEGEEFFREFQLDDEEAV